ncbi:MAG TPA: nitronate monooxygenase family protein [Patescibacteria group bacterium]|nr:nitronate monooxygenase family protein [Patescibacteria group bacterium]
MSFLERLGVALPIIQAPMAGVSTPAMAAAVTNAGALGSIAVGAADAAGATDMIRALQTLTPGSFNVNVFVHAAPRRDAARERAWLEKMAPLFAGFGAAPPTELRTIYKSFAEDDDMLAALVTARPRVVSFHFGLPDRTRIAALKAAGCILLSTATNLAEAEAARDAGIDAVVAQGYEAGGHRGVFDPSAPDDRLGTLSLTRLLVLGSGLPVIAAGGIMDGAGVSAALALGAAAGQLGTAFIACPESGADDAYRQALQGPGAAHTAMTRAISGRPARCLPNRFTAWGGAVEDAEIPDYPVAYDAGKALHAAARASGESGFGAKWAGQGAPLARTLRAAALVARIASEMRG